MQLFTSYRYTWWQLGIFKVCLMAIGMAFGSYFGEYIRPYFGPLIVLAAATGVYIWYVSIRQTWV